MSGFLTPSAIADPRLLATKTGEPFQPVRLYYSIPSRPYVSQRLGKLGCLVPQKRGWDWLYRAEATALTFGRPHRELPPDVADVVLGELRLPRSGGMTLQARSLKRAIEGARFFGPILGPKVVLRRGRVINRWFAGSEVDAGLPALDRRLDQNVTVIDPEVGARRMEEEWKGVHVSNFAEAEVVARRNLDRRIARREDVPPVEDFPLCPEEETPEYRDLEATLNFRLVRCLQRWQGKDVTLTEVIVQLVEQGFMEGKLP